MYEGFSEYEIKNSTVRFGNDPATRIGCVGKLSESMNAKTITKKCEGVVKKSTTRGDGTGELKFTLHMRTAAYDAMFGMQTTGLKQGVKAYGQQSRHREFCFTAEVYDEDGNLKYKAYPRCCVQTGIVRNIENGAEEVAEIEVTVAVMPDELGNGLYEAFANELTSTMRSSWLTNFSNMLITEADTYDATMTVSPSYAGVTIVDADGASIGTCPVNADNGAVTIPPLVDGVYYYVVYAPGKVPASGEINVDGAAPAAITVTLDDAE